MSYDPNTHKAILESETIRLFRQCWPEFPKGKLIRFESPDFVLRVNPKFSIGIELTRIEPPVDNNPRKLRTREIIEAAINRKEEKLKLYKRNNLSAYWLVLALNDSINSGNLLLPANFCSFEFEYSFHKVLLFLLKEQRVIDLIKK